MVFQRTINFLARSANLPTGLYILLSVISSSFYFFLIWAKLSQYLLELFSRFFFTKCKEFAWFSRSGPVFPIPHGTLSRQPILWQNYLPPALITLSFENGMGYRYLNVRINSVNDASILCDNFVKFGPVVFELKWGRKWTLFCDLSEISQFLFIWHTGILKRIQVSQFWFWQVNRRSFMHILWKFGKVRISDPRVLGERCCTAGVDNCYHG